MASPASGQAQVIARLLVGPINRRAAELSPRPGAESAGGAAGAAGAVVEFWGIVREWEDPTHVCGPAQGNHDPHVATDPPTLTEPFRVTALDYEAHPEMAQHQLERVAREVAERHGLLALCVLHRTGRVPVGEASLYIRIHSSHRAEALRACAEFIDELKTWVPIWKHPERA